MTIVDRRARPSNGYRAVHVLVATGEHRVEVQVRTALQQLWAELSEKLSDRYGIAIKYGGGDATARGTLDELSELVEIVEHTEETSAAHTAAAEETAHLVRRVNFETAQALLLRAITRFTAPDA